jgi:selenoprotein W-related protein
VGLANELLERFEADILSITLVPSQGGRFEVSVDGQLIYSKLKTGRHANPGEVVESVRNISRSKFL